ncbi:uncharacterized protein AB9X84_005617 [Acanthopagrus schlegelii]
MGKVLFGIIAAVASIMLVDSLTCNECKYGLLGFCLSNSEITCATNTSQCSSGKTSFPSISTSIGFNTLGCTESTACNITANATIIGVAYTSVLNCCGTDKCNTVALSGAPSTKMTLTAAVSAAILASVWGSML